MIKAKMIVHFIFIHDTFTFTYISERQVQYVGTVRRCSGIQLLLSPSNLGPLLDRDKREQSKLFHCHPPT